jgi:hypothetical protein
VPDIKEAGATLRDLDMPAFVELVVSTRGRIEAVRRDHDATAYLFERGRDGGVTFEAMFGT